jgi:hypothetical protein
VCIPTNPHNHPFIQILTKTHNSEAVTSLHLLHSNVVSFLSKNGWLTPLTFHRLQTFTMTQQNKTFRTFF